MTKKNVSDLMCGEAIASSRSTKSYAIRFLALCILLATANPVFSAPLALTAAGIADGFTLTNFASGFNSGGVGPLGVAVLGDGNVLVDASNLGANYVFHDVDGQTLGTAVSHTPFNGFPPAYASVGGVAYGSQGGRLVKFNNDGTINTTFNLAGLNVSNGMWTNPVNGHIIASGGSIYDIDVSGATPTFRVINNSAGDGLTVSPDGSTVYTSTGIGYSIATGAQVFGPVSVPGADGIGVITSSNSLNGDLVVNSNFGTLTLIDKTTLAQTVIANGGTRGDYVASDPNGSLFVTQSESVLRLSCGPGCSIGGPPPPVAPEPASLMLLGSGILALAFARRRKNA